MTETDWLSTPLNAEHDFSQFNCGVASLNEWAERSALRAQAAGASRTWVWVHPPSTQVRAYYSIAPTQVVRGEVSARLSGGYSVIPAYLLARLALDRSMQGQGLGDELMVDALTRIVEASATGGGRLIVVDAIDEAAASFYSRFGFHPVSGDGRRLAIKIATVRSRLRIGMLTISASPESGLGSMTMYRPDGSTVPVVLTPEQMTEIGNRMLKVAQQRKAEGSSAG